MAALATVQYYQVLRISEAAGLHWEDITLNRSRPRESRLLITRSIQYARGKGAISEIVSGFKNSDSMGGYKESPIFPETYEALKRMYWLGAKGLVFKSHRNTFFTYSAVSNAYNRAFKAASLPYTATHVLRHGWTREILEETEGDYDVAGQMLGNKSDVKTYARRRTTAVRKVINEKWARHDEKSLLVAILKYDL